jgi:hypothetical protein
MRPWPCETKWGARRSPLCISSFMKNASLLSTPTSAYEIWQLFCSFTPHCEQASDSLIRNLALINLINISVSVSQAPSSVFGTAVRAWRRQGTRVNKTADSPNRKPMSPLMSASRLHFFLPLLCGGNTVRSVEEQEGVLSPGLALWQLCDAPAGDAPDPRSYETSSVHPDATSSTNTNTSAPPY